jgi:serine/threonine-protein kinase
VEFVDGGALPCRTPYVVLELLEGETLRERLARGPLPLDEAIGVAGQVGAALAAAHRAGVVHRDLKPDNVFLCRDATSPGRAKILDFGLSTSFDGGGDTELIGTPRYMAPEQATRRNDLVDRRTDVFAFGALVYEMLAGRPAFDAEGARRLEFQVVFEEPPHLAEVVPGLPDHVAAAVHRALEKRREDRFPRVSDFVEALSAEPPSPFDVLSLEALGASCASVISRASAFATAARPRRSRWAAAAVAAVLAAGALTLAAVGSDAAPAAFALDESPASGMAQD